MYTHLLFDLDGTLTDSGIGITNSVRYALQKFGIQVEDRTSLYPFIGPPLKDSLVKYYGFSDEQCELGVQYYREYFKEKGMYENAVYDGVFDLLQRLKEKKRTLILATSKPEPFTVEIAKHFSLYDKFAFIAAASMDDSRSEKADVIRYAMESCHISDKSSAVMIGDRENDILGAKENGLDSIGVLYGYGSREELENAGATYIAKKPEDILRYI